MMNEEPKAIDSLSSADLIPALRTLAQSEDAVPLDWQAESLSPGLNPFSLGVYKVSGTYRAAGMVQPFTMALKMSQSPARLGIPTLGGDDMDPGHWNYWKREMNLFRAQWLQETISPLGIPVFYAAHQPQGGEEIWLFMEFVDAPAESAWSLDEFCFVTREFGRLNGRHAGRPLLHSAGWLAKNPPVDMAAQIMSLLRFLDDPQASARYWSHPVISAMLPHREFMDPLRRRPELLEALARVPLTIGHNDAFPTNLKLLRDAQGKRHCIGLDWAMLGYAPLGSELVQLIYGGILTRSEHHPRQIDQAMFAAYLEGLAEAGWQGDESLVRLGFVAAVILRMGAFALWLSLSAGIRVIESQDIDEFLANLNPDMLNYGQPMADYVNRYHEEALQLVEQHRAQK